MSYTFEETKAIVKILQDEANKKIVAALNNCDEEIVIGICPPEANHLGDIQNEPIVINVGRRYPTYVMSGHYYSKAST